MIGTTTAAATTTATTASANSVAAQSASTLAGSDQVRVVVIATLIVIIVGIVVVWPFFEKLRSLIGAATQPEIDAHDADEHAHPQIRDAQIALTNIAADLQRQITTEAEHRKEALQSIQQQLQLVVRMLDRQDRQQQKE